MDVTKTSTGKVVPPAVPDTFITRPKLDELLDDALGRRLTNVVAGAGFGKSTLLANWSSHVRCAWYTADRSDRTLAVFGRGLIDALRLRVPALFPGLESAVEGLRGPDEDELARAEALAGLLCEALYEDGGSPLVVVVDDVQELLSSPHSARLVEGLCRQSPDHFHLVLASRIEPSFAIERLRGRGQVLEIGADKLAFSLEETTALVVRLLGEGAMPLVGRLHALTAGWPAAVRLVIEAMRAAPADRRERVLDRLPRRGGPLFTYLAKEVFEQESAGVQDFIRRVAPLQRFNAELCDELGIESADEIVLDLRRRGVFVEPAGGVDGWFSLSRLMRDFALEHLSIADEERLDLHRLAARWFEKNGHIDDALAQLTESKDVEGVESLLREHGSEALSAGAVDGIIAASELLGGEQDVRVEQAVGEARMVRGDWDGALACFTRAARESDHYSPAFAWRMGLIHHLRGDFDKALDVYERADIDAGDRRNVALLLAWKASVYWVRGEPATCFELAQRALDAATDSQDAQALAAAHTVLAMHAAYTGDRRASETHYFLALNAAERAGDVLQLVRIGANRASHFSEEGMFRDALAQIERVIPLAETTGFATYLGLCLINRAEALAGLGRLEESRSEFEAAKSLYERIGSTDVCYAFVGLGDVHRERGDLSVARAAYEEAIRIGEEARDAQGLVPGLAGLARVLATEDPERAVAAAHRAVEYEPSLWNVQAHLALGWVALAQGDAATAGAASDRAAGAARERRDRAGLAEALELEALSAPSPREKAACLEEAISIWGDLGNPLTEARAQIALARIAGNPVRHAEAERAEKVLRDLGVRTHVRGAGALLHGVSQQPVAVVVETLGGLRLVRDGHQVPASEWKSKKARDLLKILIARRGRMTPREYIMGVLWPEEEDPSKLANRFSVALATLRTMLDPVKRFGTEHFVVTDKDALGLDLEHVVVDVETFLATAEEGEALVRSNRQEEGLSRLAMAEETYGGDFLEGDPYEDWAEPLREEARATYLVVARALARTAAGDDDHDAAGRYYLRLLERDPYDEGAHLGLVATLGRAGRHGEARRTYRNYVRRMGELGVEAAPFPGPRAF